MPPKRATKKNQSPRTDPHGMFAGMLVFFVESGVQTRRLQIWKQKLEQMGATMADHMSKKVTHVFALNSDALLQRIGHEQLERFKAKPLSYKWLEDSLRLGEKSSEDLHSLPLQLGGHSPNNTSEKHFNKSANEDSFAGDRSLHSKKIRTSPDDSKNAVAGNSVNTSDEMQSDELSRSLGPEITSSIIADTQNKRVSTSDSSLIYSPPDLNRNITEIFGKLINIYRALGDDRRSFSYHKAIPVIEKLHFKIESVDQVKHLPAIGKSMQDHIQEIVTTGKMSKLEHFEKDEKVRTISLFGEVWGIGPATALKLYEKGYRTLDDLKNEDSLTHSQRLGLKYFDDIKTRIPRDEVQEMEQLLRKAAQEILPGVEVVCGGSYRRGKASCGDLDIIMTHPDGKSQIGFLQKYVKLLKDMKFLREDLIFSTHSEEGTDSGVDTYFGLCTYPGRELRHRIDLKVYPRDIYAFGLIAWTGNDVLNRRLRLLAESKGFRLDDTGLFLAIQSSGGKRGSRASTSLKFDTEKEVLDFLGFPWLEPHERNL